MKFVQFNSKMNAIRKKHLQVRKIFFNIYSIYNCGKYLSSKSFYLKSKRKKHKFFFFTVTYRIIVILLHEYSSVYNFEDSAWLFG